MAHQVRKANGADTATTPGAGDLANARLGCRDYRRLLHSGPTSPPVPHADSRLQVLAAEATSAGFEPVEIETPSGLGHFAASFGLTLPADLDGDVGARPRLVVDVEVESG